MSPAQEWEKKRKERESGALSPADWIKWAEAYIGRMSGGPWRKHCEAHLNFVKQDARNKGLL